MLIRNPVFAKHLNLLTSVIRTDAATNDSYLTKLNLTGRTRGAVPLSLDSSFLHTCGMPVGAAPTEVNSNS